MTAKWRNWARTEKSRPVLEIAPRTIDQVVLAVQRARETGHTVKPIGASHSFTAIGATDGVRLSMESLRGLVDVEKVPSEKGPPRKVYSLNARGREQLAEFRRTWSFLAERIEQLHREHADSNANPQEED